MISSLSTPELQKQIKQLQETMWEMARKITKVCGAYPWDWKNASSNVNKQIDKFHDLGDQANKIGNELRKRGLNY